MPSLKRLFITNRNGITAVRDLRIRQYYNDLQKWLAAARNIPTQGDISHNGILLHGMKLGTITILETVIEEFGAIFEQELKEEDKDI